MQVLDVSMNEQRRDVPVAGWDSVVKAISIYSQGYTPRANDANHEVGRQIEEADGAGALGLFLLSSLKLEQGRDRMVDRLLFEAGQTLERRPSFKKSYDYDGMGTPFMKTNVTFNKLDRGMFSIGLYASYVGNEPEIGLAEYLGIPRTLHSCTIEVSVEKAGDNRFELDFAYVRDRLDGILSFSPAGFPLSAEDLAVSMVAQTDVFGDENPKCGLHHTERLAVWLHPGRVEERFKYNQGNKQDTWAIDGTTFSGRLKRDYGSDNDDAKENPSFIITVTSAQKFTPGWRSRDSMPLWHPDEQQEMIDLAGKIKAALN